MPVRFKTKNKWINKWNNIRKSPTLHGESFETTRSRWYRYLYEEYKTTGAYVSGRKLVGNDVNLAAMFERERKEIDQLSSIDSSAKMLFRHLLLKWKMYFEVFMAFNDRTFIYMIYLFAYIMFLGTVPRFACFIVNSHVDASRVRGWWPR